MKRLFLLLVLGVAAFAWMNRQRLFLRDPLGEVDRNGVKQAGAQVFINFSNDVLLKDGGQWILVQGWDGVVGVPTRLSCLQGLECMTEADHAGVTPAGTQVQMSSELITFVDDKGVAVRVTPR